ncbi:hypothetical protein D3C71_2134790 [compost metagenome]
MWTRIRSSIRINSCFLLFPRGEMEIQRFKLDGTWTMAKNGSSSGSIPSLVSTTARYKDWVCTSGNGRDWSTAMGVSTG